MSQTACTFVIIGAASFGACLGFMFAAVLHAGADADEKYGQNGQK